jgi:hypothetical protein
MAGKDSQDGCATVAGGAVIGCIVLVSMIPMPVWIGFGIAAAAALVAWVEIVPLGWCYGRTEAAYGQS